MTCQSIYAQCGIRQYGEQLDRELMMLVEVPSFTYRELDKLVDRAEDGDVVLFQFEPGIILDRFGLVQAIERLHKKNVRVAFVCHWFSGELLSDYKDVDLFILHRDYDISNTSNKKCVVIPHGCPIYEPSLAKRLAVRKQRRWDGKFVVTTAGFLSSWKKTPEVVSALIAKLQGRRDVLIHVHGSRPLGAAAETDDEKRMKLLEKRWRGRLSFSQEFLAEEDLLDLIHASDLGFVYHGVNSGSVSGATKQYVSARCPLVITESSHASDMSSGIVRAAVDLDAFCDAVVSAIADAPLRERLRCELEAIYGTLNWTETARRYVQTLQALALALP